MWERVFWCTVQRSISSHPRNHSHGQLFLLHWQLSIHILNGSGDQWRPLIRKSRNLTPVLLLNGVHQRLVLEPIICQHGFSYHCYADDTSCTCLFPQMTPQSQTVTRTYPQHQHHLLFNLANTELLVFPANQYIHRNIDLKIKTFSLLLPWRLFEIWSHDWLSTATPSP